MMTFIQPRPVLGTYTPDAIAACRVKGRTYPITANEGYGRENIYDDVSEMEQAAVLIHPNDFHSTNNANDFFDDRSEDKGIEPEGVTIGKFKGRNYAFVGMEHIGGVMIFDVSDPKNPRYVSYTNNRDFLVEDIVNENAGDLASENLLDINEDQQFHKMVSTIWGFPAAT